MALDKFQPYLFVSAGEQSNKFLTPAYADGIAKFQAQRAQSLTGLTVRIDPIQEGTGDPSPDNIRPISGRTGLTVTRAGKNLFPSKTISLGGTNPRTLSINLPYTLPAGEYIMSYTVGGTGTGDWGINFFYGSTRVGGLDTRTGIVTMSAPANRIYIYMAQADYDAGYTRIIDNIQLELGTVATTYTPYVAPTTYPITWESIAGTVYGGTLDVVSGVLTVDRAIVDMGTFTWTKLTNLQGRTYFRAPGGTDMQVASSADVAQPILSSNYPTRSWRGTLDTADNDKTIAEGWTGQRYIVVRDSTYNDSDASAFKAAMNGVMLCYTLATPQTYQLTPTDVKTLAGFNQIYSDAGPVIDIKF